MSIKVSGGGGGGGGYPGVTGDGQTPGGLTVAGAINVGNLTDVLFQNILGSVQISAGDAILNDGDGAIYASLGGTMMFNNISPAAYFQRTMSLNGHQPSSPAFVADDKAGSTADIAAFSQGGWFSGTKARVNHAGGVGMFGAAGGTAPRTLAQSTIDAITDTNAKDAAQAFANALSDMGALTLT